MKTDINGDSDERMESQNRREDEEGRGGRRK